MAARGRKSTAGTARTGGMADLMTGDLKREAPLHPQGAGGIDPGDDADEKTKKRTKKRLASVLR